MKNKALWIAFSAMGALLLLLALVFSEQITHLFTERQSRPPATRPSTAAVVSARFSPPRALKVGVIVSHYTAVGPNWTGKPYGYFYPHTIKELRDPKIRIIPLIEPETAMEPDVAAALAKDFKGTAPMDITDAAALSTLDVIATAHASNALPQALVAVECAVRDGGVGFLSWGHIGMVNPGFGDPIVTRLSGLRNARFGCTTDKFGTELEVVCEHPIAGALKAGSKLKIQPYGSFGPLNPPAVGLVKVSELQDFHLYNEPMPTFELQTPYVIYVSQLGKGRIVGLSIPAFRELPPSVNRAVGGRFIARCCAWLAERGATTQGVR